MSNQRIYSIAITRICASFGVSAFCAGAIFCAPAFAGASLPIVNIGAGAVSARALFGDIDTSNVGANVNSPGQSANTDWANLHSPLQDNVSAEDNNAVTVAPYKAPAKKPSVIARTAAVARDILSPKKPSSDIWAQNAAHMAADAPLRTPRVNEFAVIGDDFELPEESLSGGAASAPKRAGVARAATQPVQKTAARTATAPAGYADDIFGAAAVPTTVTIAPPAPRATQNYDTKLATLTENYKKLEAKLDSLERTNNADINIASRQPVARAAQPIATRGSVGEIVGRVRVPDDAAPKAIASNTANSAARGDVAVRQMVVPMDDNADDARFAKSDVRERPVANAAKGDNFAYNDETPLTKLSPMQLKKAFQKTYLSENKHLSTYQIDDGFDVSSNVTPAGFDSSTDLSEKGGIRPLEIKIGFRAEDAALSRDNYNLLSEYASTVVANPKRAIQVSIPERATRSFDDRKLAARRLAIIEQVLKDTGVSDARIMPVLSQRSDDSFVLRVISSDQFETLTSNQRDMFGDTVSSKSYKSMKW